MASYVVQAGHTLSIKGKPHTEDSIVEVDDNSAKRLLAAGVIGFKLVPENDLRVNRLPKGSVDVKGETALQSSALNTSSAPIPDDADDAVSALIGK